MSEWKPIETAPKETWVLGYIPEGVQPQRTGLFDTVWIWPVFNPNAPYRSWEAELGEEGGHAETGWYPVASEVRPTHWMPLPSPPSDGHR